MKLNLLIIALVTITLVSCKKDNYDEPSSTLSGKFVYKGEPVGVAYDRVPFELFQYGFGTVTPITTSIAPDGSYSHLLFNGEYKLTVRLNQGPFAWTSTGGKADSITIAVNGATNRDIEVEPYYMVRTPQISHNAGKVKANFKIEKIITDARQKTIQTVGLFINKTAFVSNENVEKIGEATIAGGSITDLNNVNLEVTIPSIIPAQKYVFARIGIKSTGVEDWIFSPLTKIEF